MARIKVQTSFEEESRVGKAWVKVLERSRARLGRKTTISEVVQDLILGEEHYQNESERHSRLNLSHLVVQDLWLDMMRKNGDTRPEHLLLRELEDRAAELSEGDRSKGKSL